MNQRLRWPALLVLLASLSACIEPSTSIRRERRAGEVVRSASTAPVQSGTGSYVVQGGDTLFRIAFRFQTTVDDLVRWNGIADRNRIQVGQRLQVASEQLASAPPVTAVPATTAYNSNPPPVAISSGEPAQRGVPADALPAASAPGVQAGTGVVTAGVSDDGVRTTPRITPPPPPRPAGVGNPAVSTTAALPAVDPEATLASPSTATSVPPAGSSSAPAITSVATPNAVRNGWSWPVAGRLVGTFVAADATRSGIDIAGNEGQPVHAAADGEVVYSGTGIIGYGELIVIQHPSGLLSAYGHNRKRLVTEGAKIKRGQQIAELGRDASGRQLLHFEVRKSGKPVDPLAYLPGR